MSELDWAEAIAACRRSFGDPPRSLDAQSAARFRIEMPLRERLSWTLTTNPLRKVLRDQDVLRDQGRVTWGGIALANNALFDPANRRVLPAMVLYDARGSLDATPARLRAIGSTLAGLVDARPEDRELRPFARAVTKQYEHFGVLRVPASLAGEHEVVFTPGFIVPAHLPTGFLTSEWFPAVSCPERTAQVMVLPEHWWPPEMNDAWSSGEEPT